MNKESTIATSEQHKRNLFWKEKGWIDRWHDRPKKSGTNRSRKLLDKDEVFEIMTEKWPLYNEIGKEFVNNEFISLIKKAKEENREKRSNNYYRQTCKSENGKDTSSNNNRSTHNMNINTCNNNDNSCIVENKMNCMMKISNRNSNDELKMFASHRQV